MMDWSYVAGFFDGEGSVTRHGNGYRVTIPQTNFEVLQKIMQSATVGHVVGLRKRQEHWKDCWMYYITKQSDVELFLRHIAPHVLVKKKPVEQALKNLRPFLIKQKVKQALSISRKKKAIQLRGQGYTYREIGKRIGTDWGYARRLTLR